mgnify:FL=1
MTNNYKTVKIVMMTELHDDDSLMHDDDSIFKNTLQPRC